MEIIYYLHVAYLPLEIFPKMQFGASQAFFWLLTHKKDPNLSHKSVSQLDLYKKPQVWP